MAKRWKLVGGRLSLDFVNTLSWRGRVTPREDLVTYADLLDWSAAAGIVPATKKTSSAERETTLTRARALRESISRLLVAWFGGQRLRRSDLERLNQELPRREELYLRRGKLVWGAPAHAILGPIAQCAADLLTEGERERLKSCGSEECAWLFYDESRTGGRRWCSMADCGNRAKARRHYDRKRSVATTFTPKSER